MATSRSLANKLLLLLFMILWAPESRSAAISPYAHYKEGLQRYKERKFAEAIAEFEAAYEGKKLPSLLMNIAQIHYELGHAELALQYYERYVKEETSRSSPLRRKAEHRIAELRKQREPPTGDSPVAQSAPKATALQSPLRVAKPELLRSPVRAEATKPWHRRWWFGGTLTLASLSVVAVALGLSLGLPNRGHRFPEFPPNSLSLAAEGSP